MTDRPAATPRPIPVRCHTADEHHRMADDTADTRSQDRPIRELTAERDAARAELGRAQELIAAAKTWRAQFAKPFATKLPRMAALIAAIDALPPSLGSPADRAQDDRPGCPACSGPVRETVGMVCRTCGTDYAPAGRAQDTAAPAESAQDGPAGPGEGERTQEAVDAHLGEPAGYEIIATRLYRDRRGQLVSGNVVVASAASTRPTLAEAVDELRSILGPAERAEG